MTLTAKLEVLGQISERARELEYAYEQRGELAPPAGELAEALLVLAAAAAEQPGHWLDQREALLFVAAATVNWLLAGDRNHKETSGRPLDVLDLAGAVAAARVERECHWLQDRASAQDMLTHVEFHYGNPCPYEAMAAVLRGEPDPRDAELLEAAADARAVGL